MNDTGAHTQDKGAEPALLADLPDIDIRMSDRSAPAWAGFLAAVFAVASGVCLLGAALMAAFFQSLVAERGELILAPLLLAVGAVPVIGSLILDYAFSRALAGYRRIRHRLFRQAQAYLAGLIFAALSLVHPLLGLGIPASAAVSAGGLWLLSRRARAEPLWDFKPAEAVSILSGRDDAGLAISRTRPVDHALTASMHRVSLWLSVLVALASGSWLVAQEVLAPAALPASALITLWSADACARFFRLRFGTEAAPDRHTRAVKSVQLVTEEEDMPEGLRIRALSAHHPRGHALLSELSFDVPPGSVTGILGDSGAGKSLLLRAISDPFALRNLEVRGNVRVNDEDLWRREARARSVQCVLLPARPIILPASGRDNLAAFQDSFAAERGRKILEQLVFSSDLVEEICAASDAGRLPDMQQKALALARAFLLAPSLYLLDRPEDGLPDKQVAALLSRIGHETRLGRSALLVTENRALLERCDRLIILQQGRIVDYGEAGETRARMAAGWMRFVGARRLDTEDNLESWVRSHFKRNGDEANRRKVCMIASEMLAFSCRGVSDVNRQTLSFEFKHFEGHCILKLQDSDVPVSSAQLQAARRQTGDGGENTRLSPLARILRDSLGVETNAALDRRELIVKAETYDPRKTGTQKRFRDAATGA